MRMQQWSELGQEGPPVEDHLFGLGPEWSLWRTAAVRSAGMPFRWIAALGDGQEPEEAADASRRIAPRSAEATDPSQALRRIVTEPAFLEALTWQNPVLVGNWVGRYVKRLRNGDVSLSRRAQREATLAHYLQRYCAKNDTIGAFGPVAWATVGDPTVKGVRQAGSMAIRGVSVHIEPWVADAVARAWARDPRLTPYLVPRLEAASFFDGTFLHRPPRRPRRLPAPALALISEIDGISNGAQVAARAASRSGPDVEAGELLSQLRQLEASGVIRLGPLVPTDGTPEVHLRLAAEHVDDPHLRRELEVALDTLEQHKDELGRSVGSPDDILAALVAIGHDVRAMTGCSNARTKDEVKVGRSVAYHDCRRDLDVRVGADLLTGLRTPLSLLLRSARWLCSEVAAAVDDRLNQHYRDLTLDSPGTGVPLLALLFAAAEDLAGTSGSPVHEVVDDFQLRWAEIIPDGTSPVVQLSGIDIEPLVLQLFPDRPVRWAAARQHSPDLMAGRSPAEGKWFWVLGELHLALNTLENRVFVTHSDDPEWMRRATARDMAGGRIVPVFPRSWPDVSARTYPPLAIDPGNDYYRYWSFDADEGHSDPSRVVPGAALSVYAVGRELWVRSDIGDWEAPLLEVLGEFLSILVVDRFVLRRPATHLPRVIVDDMVVSREAWRLDARQITVPNRDHSMDVDAVADHLRCRGVTRHLFAQSQAEAKPFYVDSNSPLLLRNLTRAIQRIERERPDEPFVEVTEMLPGPDDLWLSDGKRQRYTSEFRVVAVDAHLPLPALRSVHDQ
jgi:Lantibiotic dehydratase, N terminus